MTVDAYRKAAEMAKAEQRTDTWVGGWLIRHTLMLEGVTSLWTADGLTRVAVTSRDAGKLARLMHAVDLGLAIIDADTTSTYLTGAAASADGVPASVHASMARQSAERALAAKTQEASA